jgi:hypothetical protein
MMSLPVKEQGDDVIARRGQRYFFSAIWYISIELLFRKMARFIEKMLMEIEKWGVCSFF